MKRALILLLLLVVAAPSWAADKPLTKRERKDRIAKLDDPHRQFLMDVEPIMVDTERETFLRLETAPQRDAFIDDFWRRRDIARGTKNLAAKDEYYDRLEHVKTAFEGASSDRGRLWLVHGAPAVVVDVNCTGWQPMQVWQYEYFPGFGSDFRLLFYQPRLQDAYRLWTPFGDPERAQQELAATGMGDASVGGGPPANLVWQCRHGEYAAAAISGMKREGHRLHTLYDPPPVNEEDVNRILRSVVLADPNAPKLAVESSVAFPAGDGNKTDAQITIIVPRAQLKTTSAGETSVYTLEVIGEVLREEKMYEKYRYRFDFPGTSTDEKFAIVIDRLLRPAEYMSRVKVTDPASGAQVVLETPLNVPEVLIARPASAEALTLRTIQDDLQSTRASVRIVPLETDTTGGVTSGLQTIQTIVNGNGVKGVEFWLDGKKVATRRTPPYTLDLDFGTVPRSRKIRAVAIDSHDQPITGDEIVVNTGTDPFRVRIASPRVAPKLAGPTRVELDVRVPQGKVLGSVELYWNETRVATMFDPPFVHTVNVPKSDGVGYLRAVATLKDSDVDPAEDVVMVNTPDYMETIDVHLVELPATVLRDGKPVNGLTESAFKVLDAGQPVKISKFEHVKNLPLSVGMAIDASGSMEERMQTAREAGASFFKNVLRKGDKAFLVAFDSQPHMMQKWSTDLADIQSGLARLRPEESTALYDAVVYSLYNFLGVKGQKALVLLTDGKDTASKFTYDQALEYAQRAAVPIYTIGLGIRGADLEVKMKLNRLSTETGGTPYYIDSVADLVKVYTDIQNELRSQYVLGFYPSADVKTGGKWREVTVQTTEGKVKTIRGYYP
jgi:Ca-activated chloride channel homolog